MARRLCSATLLVAAVSLALGSWGAAWAYAEEPDAQGWWTATDPGGLPAQPPAAPDVPSDGLLLQTGSTTPTAYAALVYAVPEGETADSLTLTTAPNAGTSPSSVIDLCPLKSPSFTPEQGGSIANAPAYDCTKKVTAILGADGVTFKVAVGGLVSDGHLAVALLPGASTLRVVLSKADASSLTTTLSSTPPPAVVPDEETSTGSPTSQASTGTDSSATGLISGVPFPALNPSSSGGVVPPLVAGTGPAPASDSAPPANPSALAPVARTGNDHSRLRVLLLIAAAGLAAAFWSFAGTSATRIPAGSPELAADPGSVTS